MKTVIYYFSGTGNTLAAARRIAAAIENCQLLPVVREFKNGNFITDADRIIFLFPLYFLSFPKIVMDFIQRFDFGETAQIICIATRGFKPMGGVLAHFRRILRDKKRKLHMGFYIDMPSNDVTLFNIPGPDQQKKQLAGADKKIDQIVDAILTGKPAFDPEPLGFMKPLRHGPAYLNQLDKLYKEFYTQDTCTGCGICAKVCPLENIEMKEKQPIWHKNCQLCEACINYCPAKAIQFGKQSLKKGRYVHPQVSFREIAGQRPELGS